MSIKALVLGGAGFIGNRLTRELISEGFSVRVAGRRSVEFVDNLNPFAEYAQCDLSKSDQIEHCLDGISIVFHLASSSNPALSNGDPVADISTSVGGTVRLLDAMVRKNIKRIVYISSGGTVYGNIKEALATEDMCPAPISAYGITKVAVENYLMMYGRLYGISPLILRVSNPYGPGQFPQKGQGVVAAFLSSSLLNKPINLIGGEAVERDFIYIDDLASAIAQSARSLMSGVYNLGSGQPVSLGTIISLIEEVTSHTLAITSSPSRPFDVKRIALDMSKFYSESSWRPQTSLRSGITKHWHWIQSSARNIFTLR